MNVHINKDYYKSNSVKIMQKYAKGNLSSFQRVGRNIGYERYGKGRVKV